MAQLTRRDLLKAVGLGTTGLLMPRTKVCAQEQPKGPSASRPNIIFIMADDLGFSDLGCYGSEIDTPNLDQLAADGLRFTQFYNNAKCAPSRVSLLTGAYPHREKSEGIQITPNIAQALRSAGYRTLMTGKNGGGLAGLPTEQGFDRFYGLNDGACNFFNPGLKRPGENEPGRKYPGEQRSWSIDGVRIRPYTPEDPDFYTTDAFTDAAVDYLDEYGTDEKPFFLYVSYTAPHFPLQAWPEDIAKYRGKYKVGWDAIRRQRYERMVEMGLIDKAWKMSPLDQHVPKWEDVQDKESADLDMAVYAAMIDRMDQGIGRILDKVRELSIQDNTLVMFISDNGSCAEDFNAFNTTNKEVPPGPMESYRTLGVGWANASNTPFRKYKWWNHEGGMATPMIAYWPKVIKNGGQITHQVGHLIDIMATCTDAAGAEPPLSYNGAETFSREGKSLLPILRGEERQGHEAIYWKFGSSFAVRKGKWKLVASHPDARTGIDYFSARVEFGVNGNPDRHWELYDMALDRTELNDLAEKHPEKVKEMADLFDAWVAQGRTK